MDKDFILIVSLPKNSLELAKEAANAGCDALKLHLNTVHPASKTSFGSWGEEKIRILEILKEVPVPVGIMPGHERVATEEEIKEMEEVGIDFFDIYLKDCPTYLLNSKMKKMLALDHSFDLNQVKKLNELDIDFIEASIIEEEGYDKFLNILDVVRYKSIVDETRKAVIVPTQRKIKARDIPLLKRIGLKGIMIGAVVTGKTSDQLRVVTKMFRKAIDEA